MTTARFADLLECTMGLNAASIGASAVERAVEARMRAHAAESRDAYWDLLQHSREELQNLIETTVVPETWFFRDPQAFPAMTGAAMALRSKDMARPLRLLSLPCSTGEEPYTMAMALLDAGLPATGFRIDAIDISALSLARATAGIYGRNSFRGQNLGFRDRHFAAAGREYQISDAVRAPVHFRQGNMLGDGFLAEAEAYDVIFCRNLLIYFDAPTQARAIAVLERLLMPEGMLFAGHAEAGVMSAAGLVSAKIPMAFAFRKAPPQPSASAASTPCRASSSRRPGPPVAPRSRTKAPRLTGSRPLAAAALPPPPLQSIEELRRMADCGQLDKASRGVDQYLRECGPSAEALLLLGLISDASGDGAAAQRHYRKALYLEPGNNDALGHLALLLKRQGDHAGARLIDDRLRRRDERSPS